MSAPTFVVTMNSQLSIVETLVGVGVSPGDNTVTLNGLNETVQLNGSSTPPVSKCTIFPVTLSGGAATIDLTALPGLTNNETIDASGLKGQFLKLTNPATNANKIIAAQGGSNPWRLDGATNWSVALAPGQSVLFNLDNLTDAVGSGNKTIDLTGTGSQVLDVAICLG